MSSSVGDESAQWLREIMARQGQILSLDEARELGEWLLDLIEILAPDGIDQPQGI